MQTNVNFFVVYCKTRKKTDKYLKVNRIKNKYIIDIKKVMEFPGAKTASADSDDNWRDDHSNLDSDW